MDERSIYEGRFKSNPSMHQYGHPLHIEKQRLEKSENIFYYLHFDILHFNIIAVESNTSLLTFYQFSDSVLAKLLEVAHRARLLSCPRISIT